MNHQVRITVFKRGYEQDLADRFLANPQTGKCSIFQDGQTFLVTKENYDNFPYENHCCVAAWDVIKNKVYAALQGGTFYWAGWMKDQRQQILCCDDGVRPVVFLLEKSAQEEQ